MLSQSRSSRGILWGVIPLLLWAFAVGADTADPLPPHAIARLGTERFNSGGFVERVVANPDGSRAALVTPQNLDISGDFGVTEIDTHSGRITKLYSVKRSFTSPAYSPDGQKLAVAGPRVNTDALVPVIILDAEHGRELQRLKGHKSSIGFVLFAGNSRLVSGGQDRLYRIWDLATGAELRKIPRPQFDSLNSEAVSCDGRYLACVERDKSPPCVLRIYGIANENESAAIEAPTAIEGLVFAPDAKSIVAIGPTIYRFDLASGRQLGNWKRPSYRSVVACSNDATFILNSVDGELQVDALEAQQPARFPLSLPICLVGRSTTTELFINVRGSRLEIWDLKTGQARRSTIGHENPVTAAAWTSDGRAVTADQNSVCVWDATGHEVRHLFCRPKNIETYNAVLSVDGRLVANTDAGGMIRFWETETGKNVDSMRGGHNPFCGIALSTDARFVGNPDWQLLRIFRTQPGEKIWQTQANPWPFQSAVFAADNLTVFSGDQAGTIREWTVANGREFRTLQPHPELVACPPRMGQPHPSPRPGHMHSVRGMAISPDGRRLVSVGDEATVRLWELASGGECALVAKADQLPAATLVAPGIPITFSGDGNMIATPGLDSHRRRIIDVWDSRTGAQIATFEGHRAAITALSFSPDGRRLISGGMDTIGYIWEVPPIKRERIETIPDGAANSLWHELADDDAAKAYRAISKWLSAPDFAIEYLRRSFVPATAINAERVDKLVVDLDSDKFAVRDNASRELSLLGPGVHDHLKRALRTSPSLEVTRRIEALLAVKSDEGLRRRRAIEIVEAIGTPAAESLLKDWSAANPDSVTAKDANAALGRLRRR